MWLLFVFFWLIIPVGCATFVQGLTCAKMRSMAFKIFPGYTSVPFLSEGSDPSHSNPNPDFGAARPFDLAFPLFSFCEITTRDVDFRG